MKGLPSSMMIVASALPSWGLMQMWVCTITCWRYFAAPENMWEELFIPYLPEAAVVRDVEAVGDAAGDEIDEVVDGLRSQVEAWAGRGDDGARAGQAELVLQVDHADGHLSRGEHEGPAIKVEVPATPVS